MSEPTARETSRHRYAAFISYSHQDAAVARKLHRWLERYKIPTAFGTIRITDDARIENRLFPCFLDKEELGAGSLGPLIKKALFDSSALIVLCSRSSARSDWVSSEIRHFENLGRRGRIFPVILDGEPNATGKANLELECLPPPLQRRANSMETDVLAIDARSQPRRMADAGLKIVSGVAGIPFGRLVDRERIASRRRIAVRLAAGLLACAIGIAVSVQIRNSAQAARASALANFIDKLHELGDHGADLRLALVGVARDVRWPDRSPALVLRLRRALFESISTIIYRTGVADGIAEGMRSEKSHAYIVLRSDGTLLALDDKSLTARWKIQGVTARQSLLAGDALGASVAYIADGSLVLADADTGNRRFSMPLPAGAPVRIEMSRDGEYALVLLERSQENSFVALFSLREHRVVAGEDAIEDVWGQASHLSPAGNFYSVRRPDGSLGVRGIAGDGVRRFDIAAAGAATTRFSASGRLLASLSADGTLQVIDLLLSKVRFETRLKQRGISLLEFGFDETRLVVATTQLDQSSGEDPPTFVEVRETVGGTIVARGEARFGVLRVLERAGASDVLIAGTRCARFVDSRSGADPVQADEPYCPDQGLVRAFGSGDSTLTFGLRGDLARWNGHEFEKSRYAVLDGHPTFVSTRTVLNAVAVGTSTGSFEVFGSHASRIGNWRLAQRESISISSPDGPGRFLFGSRDQQFIATVSGDGAAEGPLKEVRLEPLPANGMQLLDAQGGRRLYLTADKRGLRSMSDAGVFAVDLDSRQVTFARLECDGSAVAESDDSGEVNFWREGRNSAEGFVFVSPDRVRDFSMDQTCSYLLTAASGAILHRVEGKKYIRTLRPSEEPVAARLSPDGEWAVTMSGEARLTVWHVPTESAIAHFPGRGLDVSGAAMEFDPAHATIFAPSRPDAISAWNISPMIVAPEELISLACRRVQGLSDAELTFSDDEFLTKSGYGKVPRLGEICHGRDRH